LVPRRIDARVFYRESDVDAFITVGSSQEANQVLERYLELLVRALGKVIALSLDSDSLRSDSTPGEEKHLCPAWGLSQLDHVVQSSMRRRQRFVPLGSPSRDAVSSVSERTETVD